MAMIATMTVAQDFDMPAIPVDQAVRIGKLDNGLTYYIRHNEWPEKVANFYIAQRVGSIQEDDDQRGLAHFLEHMAFNGSEHFPDSTLLEFTRSLGVEFGSDLNAYTSIDQTVYRICNVPTKRSEALDSCVLILKDWSNGLTLADKEIDKERGVIHQEWQLGEGPMQRMLQTALPKLYPNSKYGHRMPIGLMEIVDNFPYQVLRDYYHKWYRPDNQAIIIVGDVDVDHMEQLVKQLWKDVTVPADAPKVIDELVGDNPQPIYVVEKDKEQQFSIVGIEMKHDPVPTEMKSTMAYLPDVYIRALIEMMFSQRFTDAAQKADCPFVAAQSTDGNYILSKTMESFNIDALAKDGKDSETLAAIYREAQRVKEYGFTPAEFERSKQEYISQLEKKYENRNKIENSQYGDQYRDNYLENEPIMSVEDEYRIMTEMIIPNISLDIVNMYAKERISNTDENLVACFFVQEKEGKTYPTEDDIQQTINNVRQEKLEAYVDNAKNEPLILPEAMPKKGKIKKVKENKEFGYKELTLSNGARVIIKKTDFKENEIIFQAMAKGGKGLYGPDDYSTLKLFDTGVEASGLGNFSNNELQKTLYGKQVAVSVGMGNYYQYMNGNCVPKDLETEMQLIYLHFTQLKADDEAYGAVTSQVELMLKNKDLSPEAAFSDSLVLALYDHNPRFAPLDTTDVKRASQQRMIDIAQRGFANAADFVFYFVGNYDEAQLLPLIEQYIASLPSTRKATAQWNDVPAFATGNVSNSFLREMQSPKAIAFDMWHAPATYDVNTKVLADAAAQVLQMVYLKDIREDASAAYSVMATGQLSRRGLQPFVMLQAYCPMDPAKAQLALDLIAKGMADNTVSVDADKVEKVKETMLKKFEVESKENSHWMDVIDEYIWTGVNLHNGTEEAIKALTPESIAAYLKNLVAAGNHIEVVMQPQEKK